MQFTPNILQTAGRDVCNAILSYFYKKDMIIIPKNEYRFMGKADDKGSQQIIRNSNSPIKLKIFNFEQDNLLQEIEAVQEIENDGKEGFDFENDNGSVKSKKEDDEQEVSDGSDSEPSLDNFDNDQLVKLLPSFPKKKSNFF